MDPVRPKIMNRPQRKGSNCTVESSEEQYRREQELLAAKSRRLQAAEERLLNSLYPTKEHVRARQHEILLMQEQCTAAKHEAMQLEKQLERQISQKAQEKREQAQLGNIRPWTTATLAFSSAHEEREARKHFAATVAAENLALMAERAAQRQQQFREQQQKDKQTVTNENEYWNLGASNSRWIAPEFRHLAPSSPKSSQQSGTAAACTAAVVPPWALHTEGIGSKLIRRSSLGSGRDATGMEDSNGRPYTAGGSCENRSQRRHAAYAAHTATEREVPMGGLRSTAR